MGTKPKKEETPTPKKNVTTETTQTEPTKNSSQLTKLLIRVMMIDWGDELNHFTGKNAADKTQAALKKRI